jgi:hypothetical protein
MLLASAAIVVGVGAGAVSAAAAAAPGGGVTAARHGPRIVAKPDSVMVNRRTTLTGSGFRRHKKLTILECSARNWVVPAQVCNHRNAIKIRTNAHGGFRVKIKVLVCPSIRKAVPAGFSKRCFVGVPTIRGVDTETLVGAVKITVTGP